MAQHTITIPITEDTYVDKNNPNTNYGSSNEIKIGGPSQSVFDYEKIALLKWSEATVPARKKIISRYLYLYATTQLSDQCVIIGTDPIEFAEMTATWNSAISEIDRPSAWGYEAQNVINAYVSFKANAFDTGLAMLGLSAPGNAVHTFQSRHATNKPYISIVYEDVPPSAPTPTEPIGNYKDSKKVIRFEWQYNSDVGGTQKAYDLQWSTDQINWTIITQTTSNTYYDMPADALPTGNIYWRVRTYNEYDEVGEYSAVQGFYVIGAPSTPQVNTVPTDTARPEISWSAFGQQSYQLQVLSGSAVTYDSGAIPSASGRHHKIKTWLADGSYVVKLRIMNEYGLWSEWGSAFVTIATTKPAKPTITAQQSAYGVEITISGTAEYYLIYRDGMCIGKTTSNMYIDNSVQNGKEYRYFVRAVSSDETYQDSDVKLSQASFRGSLVAPVSDLTNVVTFSHGLNSPPKRVYSRNINGASVYYSGRTYPVDEPTEHIAAAMSFTFFLRTWVDVERFIEVYDLRSTVLYRDAKGRKIYGTLSNLQVTEEWPGYIISFSISQVDYGEELEV